MAVLLVGLLYLQAYEGVRSSGRRLGFSSQSRDGGLKVDSLVPGLPAERDGLRLGDVVLTVDGEPVHNDDEYQVLASRFRRGRPVEFVIHRGAETLKLPLHPGAPFPWRDYLLDVLSVLAYGALGFLALPQVRSDVRARLLFLFGSAVALEFALPNALSAGAIGNPQARLLGDLAFYLVTGLQVGLELHLASVIPEAPAWLRRRRWIVPAYYTLGVGAGLVLAAAYLYEVGGRQILPWTSPTSEEMLNFYCLPLWAIAVLALLARPALRHPEPVGRHQAGLVMIGVLPWAVFNFVSLVAWLGGTTTPDWLNTLQPLILLCYPVAVFVAIFRYQLFDLEFVLRRGLVYSALTSVLVLVFYAAVWAGGALVSEVAGARGGTVWVVSSATLLLGLLFGPLRLWLQKMIDRRFFPERYALREHLVALAGELPAFGKVPLMGQRLADRLIEIFHLKTATVLVAEANQGILVGVGSAGESQPTELSSLLMLQDEPGIDLLRRAQRPLPASQLAARSAALAQRLVASQAVLVVPLRNQDRLIGALLLGEKRDGQPYPAEELELLNLLGHHVAAVFQNATLFASATYDGLTGLLRREAILQELEKELQRAVRYRRPLTIGLADLDHFKSVNDTYGHLAGDTMLKRVALALGDGLRSADSIGRYGGEEFLLVLPETSLDGAVAVAEKVRHLVEGAEVPLEADTPVRVTISIGLASLAELGAPPTPEALLAAADRSLYRAKQSGRNRVEPAAALAG